MGTTTTGVEEDVGVGRIDESIGRMETLFRSLTGKEPPPLEAVYAPIPVETDPVQFVEEQMDRLIAALDRPDLPIATRPFSPPMCVWDGDSELLIALDLPGCKRTDVEVTMDMNVVTITGRRVATASEGQRLRAAEAALGPFFRKVLLPPSARLGEPSARMKDGVLEIRFSKGSPEANAPKSIPVA